MDRNEKRAFVIIGTFFAWRIYEAIKAHMHRIDEMERKLNIVDETQDRMLRLLDDSAQPFFDDEFEQIIEKYED